MLLRFCVAVLAVFVPAIAQAAVISYETTDLGGGRWRYDYTVANDTPAFAIDEFTIFFAVGQYRNLALEAGPSGWDILVIQPDPALPDAGFYDGLALNLPLAFGAEQDGFAVSFDWLGQGTPGPQSWTVLDPETFVTLQAGVTVPAIVDPLPISEPGALAALASGIAALGFARRRRAA